MGRLTSNGDQEFTNYVAGSWGVLRLRAFRLCHDWDHAADLVQSALALAYARWVLVEKAANRDAYVTTIIARLHFRERLEPRWTSEIPLSELPEAPAVEPQAEAVADRLVLGLALAQLGPRQRAVVSLRLLADLPVEEVARIMVCRPSTVRSQTRRALVRLREILSEAEGTAHHEEASNA